ncbi:lysozyme inhibitor [Acinetobacter indicus]|uniref:Lysozyme inhibitor n=1 Tax=Acinetobacter indicus TaxID=756892 RepID=A0A6C0Y3P9_9GAMM|nr:lysozyme inhibitor [Acinetobacter indicus]QIC70783.1 lysozyme inhibitor [Acinetobacter indicus]
MKYLLGAILLGLALTGCTSTPQNEVVQDKTTNNTPANTQVIYFTGPMDLTLELKSSDNFETAELVDNSGKVHHLKQTIAASGVRLANDQGVSIHFKAGDGVVELVPGKPISITEFKKQ